MTTTTSDTTTDIEALTADLRRWLGSGQLQSPPGAYCAWRDANAEKLAFAYPEITGYALTWLAGLDDLTPSELKSGQRAADWLLARFAAGDRSARGGWDAGTVYTFDLGMISAGLISFGSRVANRRYITLGRTIARDLATYTISPVGLQAVAPDGPRTTRSSGWSTTGTPHLVKCVQALLLAGEDIAADHLAFRAMASQQSSGRFLTQPDDSLTMLHPHLYTVEGLWIWARARGYSDPVDRARDAVAFVWKHQLASGGLPRFVDGDRVGPEQFDVTSQAIRATILLGLQPAGLERAIERIVSHAVPTADGAGLPYQPNSTEAHLNAWVSMFGAQALMLAASPTAIDWQSLV